MEDPGIEQAIDESVGWLCRAQDHSFSQDGGVARHFSLVTGWGSSYPETTGYIVPTLLDYVKLRGDQSVRQRAMRMLDWLVSIQLPCGGFQGGTVDATPVVPVTFNTGQILLGLATGVREFGEERYWRAMCRAADWLVETQDSDGCWRQHPSPFAIPGENTYETHVALGLLEAARLAPDRLYADAALSNIRWALRLQRENGWFDKCCLDDPANPLTHTVGYALRGVIESYRFSREEGFLQAARQTGDGLLTAIRGDGFLPGRIDSQWRGCVPWACLTGSAQIAHSWLLLFEDTGEKRYLEAAFVVNGYVRRTLKVNAPPQIKGGIKGSFPVFGDYGQYEYLNWAAKFFVDSNMLERMVKTREVENSG